VNASITIRVTVFLVLPERDTDLSSTSFAR